MAFLFYIVLCLFSGVFGEVLFPDECRKRDGLWSCTDCSKCLSFDECTYEDALYKSGYYCNEWPYFNRVPPPKKYLYLPLETKHITCELQNQTTCLEWEERKESQTELAVTDCVCQDYVYEGDSDYCKTWGCIGIGLEKCAGGDWDCGTTRTIGNITFTEECCGWRGCEKR